MAEINFTLPVQQEVAEIASRVQEIAARMAGFKPALDQHLEDVDQRVGNSLAMLAGLAGYVGDELGMIGERLSAITRGRL